MNFKKILPWLIGAIVIGVIIYYATKKNKPKSVPAINVNTGIIPPNMVDYIQGDLNVDGIVNEADS